MPDEKELLSEAREWLIGYWKLTPEQAEGSSYEGVIPTTAAMLADFAARKTAQDRARIAGELRDVMKSDSLTSTGRIVEISINLREYIKKLEAGSA